MNSDMLSPIRPPFRMTTETFVSKKARTSTPYNKRAPPRPSKALTSVKRFWTESPPDKPHPVSFREDTHSFSHLDSLYDESRKESYFQQMFSVEKKLGSGYFGDVFKVKSK